MRRCRPRSAVPRALSVSRQVSRGLDSVPVFCRSSFITVQLSPGFPKLLSRFSYSSLFECLFLARGDVRVAPTAEIWNAYGRAVCISQSDVEDSEQNIPS